MRNIDLTRLRGIDHHMDRIISEYLGNRIFYEVNQINRMTQRCIQRWSRMFRDYDFQLDIPKPNDQTMDIECTFSCKIDKDTSDAFGMVNTWWVFGEVAKELSYPIFMAEAEHVGYKRTSRGLQKRPNDLFRKDDKGQVLVNDGIHETILDYVRDISWED